MCCKDNKNLGLYLIVGNLFVSLTGVLLIKNPLDPMWESSRSLPSCYK